jgi:hypothetical protein
MAGIPAIPTNRYLLQDCSRTPGLKSSLNEVHLKIHHALKETSCLADKSRMPDSGGMATIIDNYLIKPVAAIPAWRFNWSNRNLRRSIGHETN